jgi:DNA-binding NarL/FixJ family response regulator
MSPPAVIRVLVADDQRVVREGLVMLLGLLGGIEVVGAAEGEQAVALATELRPHAVVMDLRMPRVDGVAATRRLRERDPGIRSSPSPPTTTSARWWRPCGPVPAAT